jgi:hypothetical protein
MLKIKTKKKKHTKMVQAQKLNQVQLLKTLGKQLLATVVFSIDWVSHCQDLLA